MALRGAIASLTQGGPYTVTRRAAGSYVDGHYVAATGTTSFTAAGSLQPLPDGSAPVGGRQLMDLPEGQRGDDVRVLYTLVALHSREVGDPDIITIDGENYVVIRVERFDAFGDTHYRCYLSRVVRP